MRKIENISTTKPAFNGFCFYEFSAVRAFFHGTTLKGRLFNGLLILANHKC